MQVPTVNFGVNPTQDIINNTGQEQLSSGRTFSEQEFFQDVDKIKQSKGLDASSAMQTALSYYQSKGYGIEGINIDNELARIGEVNQEAEEDTGFFETLGEVVKKRGDKGSQILLAGVRREGGQQKLETGVQYASNLIAGLADVVGTTVIEGLDTVTPEVVQEKFKEGVQELADTKGGEFVSEKLQEVQGNMEDLRKYNPRAAKNFEALGDTINSALTFYTGGAATQGVKAATKTGAAQTTKEAVKTGAKATGNIAVKGVKATARQPVEILTTLTSKASGLERDTLKQVFKNPDIIKLGDTGKLTREGVAKKVKVAIDDRVEQLAGLGKEYGKIITGRTVASFDDINKILVDRTSKIDPRELTKSDRAVLNEAKSYIEAYKPTEGVKGVITDKNLHSLRKQIDSVMYDPATGLKRKLSPNGNRMLQDIRAGVDDLAGKKIKGLKELDKKFGPEVKELNKVKDLIIDRRTGDVKDNYIQTVSNLMGKGKELKLERVKKLVPEIETEINALKALQDIEIAKGNKIGTYLQAGVIGGGLTTASITANPLLAAISLLITSPTVVTEFVKALGYTAKFAKEIAAKVVQGIRLSKKEAQIVGEAVQKQIKEGVEIIPNEVK